MAARRDIEAVLGGSGWTAGFVNLLVRGDGVLRCSTAVLVTERPGFSRRDLEWRETRGRPLAEGMARRGEPRPAVRSPSPRGGAPPGASRGRRTGDGTASWEIGSTRGIQRRRHLPRCPAANGRDAIRLQHPACQREMRHGGCARLRTACTRLDAAARRHGCDEAGATAVGSGIDPDRSGG